MLAVEFRGRRAERREDRRRQILAAAEAAFADLGYRGASLQEIADRIRVDKRLLAYYVPGGKRGLYREVMEGFLARMGEMLQDALSSDGGAVDVLAARAGALHDYGARNPNHVRLVLRDLFEGGPMLAQIGGEALDAILGAAVDLFGEFRARGDMADVDPRFFLIAYAGLSLGYYALAPLLGDMLGVDLLSPEHAGRQKREALRYLREGVLAEAETPSAERTAERQARAKDLFERSAAGRPDFRHLTRIAAEWDAEPEGVRERFLRAAAALLGERGFAGASIRAIARAAGADKRMVYALFGSKRGLHDAVLRSQRSPIARYLVVQAHAGGEFADWKGEAEETHRRGAGALLDLVLSDPQATAVLLWDFLDRRDAGRDLFGPLLSWIVERDARGLEAQQEMGKSRTFDAFHFQLCNFSIVAFYALSADFLGRRWGIDLRAPEARARFRETFLRILLRGAGDEARR